MFLTGAGGGPGWGVAGSVGHVRWGREWFPTQDVWVAQRGVEGVGVSALVDVPEGGGDAGEDDDGGGQDGYHVRPVV
jgi:hypothetical protein